MTIYTITAYKPNSYQSYRSCTTARFDSDFEYVCTPSRLDAEDWLAEKMVKNQNLEHQEAGYEFTIFLDGQEEDSWPDGMTDEEYDTRAADVAALRYTAVVKADEKYAKIVAARDAEAKAKAEREVADIERREKLQLAALKAKYEEAK